MQLQAEVAPLFAAAGLSRLDLQNLQNCLCEWDKWERARDEIRAGPATKPKPRKIKAPELAAPETISSETIAPEPAATAAAADSAVAVDIPAHIRVDIEQQDARRHHRRPAMSRRITAKPHASWPGSTRRGTGSRFRLSTTTRNAKTRCWRMFYTARSIGISTR